MSRPPTWWRVLAMTISLGLTMSADPVGLAATRPVGVRILDPFTASAHEVAALHRRHWRVACLLHAGIWEPARPDAHRFAPELLGRSVTPGAGAGTGMGVPDRTEPPPEPPRWLDLSRRDTLVGILADRLAMCAAKGFDGAALADLDGDPDQTGFPLTRRDQNSFAAALRTVARRLGLTVSG